MFPALQMFSHLLVKFASIFGRPNPWKPLFFQGKTMIFKKPLFFKRWPKRTQNDFNIWRKLPQNTPENTEKANTCRFWGGPKTQWKKKSKKAPKRVQNRPKVGLNLTSRGNGKRSLESAVKMLIAVAIFGICYSVSVFVAICSDSLLFDAACCYVLPLAAARC